MTPPRPPAPPPPPPSRPGGGTAGKWSPSVSFEMRTRNLISALREQRSPGLTVFNRTLAQQWEADIVSRLGDHPPGPSGKLRTADPVAFELHTWNLIAALREHRSPGLTVFKRHHAERWESEVVDRLSGGNNGNGGRR